MSQIKVKYFGLIKSGFIQNSGFMDIHKITVFIGNQGTGKSSIAKLISTLSILAINSEIKGLPLSLYTFWEELERSQQELSDSLTLPVGDVKFEFDKLNKISNIVGSNYKLKLSEASSGFQSFVPLFADSSCPISPYVSDILNKNCPWRFLSLTPLTRATVLSRISLARSFLSIWA
jgi:hypothetical protein